MTDDETTTPDLPWTVPSEGPEDAAAAEPAPHRPSLRVGTVVWGLVIAALGVGVIAWALGARIDTQLALVVLLGGAGVALLAGSIVSGLRSSRR